MKNIFNYKIYYEDTDAGGVVYYANYLRFLERGRTDFLEQAGISSKELYARKIFFAVKKIECEYIKPVFYGEEISVILSVKFIKNSSFSLLYEIYSENFLKFKAETLLVSIDENFKISKIPPEIKSFLQRYI